MFDALFVQTAHVADRAGPLDRYGRPTHGPPVPFQCRYEPSSRMVRSSDKSEQVSEFRLFTKRALTTESLVWPPGADPADDEAARKPMNVSPHYELLSGQLSYYSIVF